MQWREEGSAHRVVGSSVANMRSSASAPACVSALRSVDLPVGWSFCVCEWLIGAMRCGPHSIDCRTRVGVPHERHHGVAHLLAADAMEGAVPVQLEELLLEGRDLLADDALVALELRLPRPAQAHAARGRAAWGGLVWSMVCGLRGGTKSYVPGGARRYGEKPAHAPVDCRSRCVQRRVSRGRRYIIRASSTCVVVWLVALVDW